MNEMEYPMAADGGMFEAIGMIGWIFMVAAYLFFAYTQFLCAKKCGNDSNAFLAFIPIANLFLLCQMARKPFWWFVLLLVPFVNVVMYAILWIEVAKICGHSGVWGFLVIVPLINFIAMAILAWGKGSGMVTSRSYAEPSHAGHERSHESEPVV